MRWRKPRPGKVTLGPMQLCQQGAGVGGKARGEPRVLPPGPALLPTSASAVMGKAGVGALRLLGEVCWVYSEFVRWIHRVRESGKIRQPRWISIPGSPLCCCKHLQNIWYVRITRFSVRSQQILSISGWDTFRASLNSLITKLPSRSIAQKHMVHPLPGVVAVFSVAAFFSVLFSVCGWVFVFRFFLL